MGDSNKYRCFVHSSTTFHRNWNENPELRAQRVDRQIAKNSSFRRCEAISKVLIMIGRKIGISAAVVVLLLVVGGFALNAWVHGWLRGPEFRALVESRSGRALGGEATLAPLVWSGPSIFSPELKLTGTTGKPISSLQAQQIRADVNWRAAFSGAWHVRRIDITRLDLAIAAAGPQAADSELGTEIAAVDDAARTTAAIPSWLPSRFELDEFAVQDANASLGVAGAIRNTQLTLKPEGAGWIFDARGGKFEPTSILDSLEIDHLRVRLQQGVVYLTDAELRSTGAGRISANGEIGGEVRAYDIRLTWRYIDSAELLDPAWEEKLTGLVGGEAAITPAASGGSTTKGKFQLTDGTLTGMPLQDEIARFTRSPQFQRMPVHELSSDFVTDGSVTDFSNFVIESKGLLRMEGAGRLGPNDAISGTFQIGVTRQTLQWLPGSQEKVFVESRDGYLWTTIQIGGTLDTPTEDLSSRLAVAMGEQVIETGTQLLKDAPENTREAVDRVIDILSPLLR
jgi:hypothetical protein